MREHTLPVAETFYSVQGEGYSSGVPSVFLRLGGCNLWCNWKKNEVDHPCDTIPVWTKFDFIAYGDILDQWEENGWLAKLRDYKAHLVVTGGEPTLHQVALIGFFRQLKAVLYPDEQDRKPYIELETNGTIKMLPEFLDFIAQINCSPKLSNSSNATEKRYKPEVLRQIVDCLSGYWFKFVVNDPKDIEEIMRDFVQPLGVFPSRVVLMPEGANREELAEKRKWVVEQCKEHGFRYSDRLQVVIYDEVVGV